MRQAEEAKYKAEQDAYLARLNENDDLDEIKDHMDFAENPNEELTAD